jgi:hypothetical protein
MPDFRLPEDETESGWGARWAGVPVGCLVCYALPASQGLVWCQSWQWTYAGPLGNVGHGGTSCILLPAVCKYHFIQARGGCGKGNAECYLQYSTLWRITEARVAF